MLALAFIFVSVIAVVSLLLAYETRVLKHRVSVLEFEVDTTSFTIDTVDLAVIDRYLATPRAPQLHLVKNHDDWFDSYLADQLTTGSN